MKITTMIMNITARAASFVAVFALMGAFAIPAFAQYEWDDTYTGGSYYDYDWEDPIYEPPIYEPPTWDWENPYNPPYLPCVDGECEYNYNWEYDYDYNYDYNYNWDYNWDYDWEYPPYEPPCSGSCGESPRPVCTLDGTPGTIEDGEDFRLEWTTRNATFVTITTLGPVDLDGSALLSPVKSMRYTLSATGPGGSVTCTENITVREEEDEDENVRCDAFTASDTRVERGDSVTLRWNTTGADSVRIDQGVGSVSDDGSERVTINRDTTYTLTARNGSDEDTCRVTVRVEEEEEEDDETAPRCRLTISDTQITSGQSVTVSWDNLRTDRAILRDNHGNTIADSRDRNSINEDRDSRVFKPTRSTDYTLTVYKGNTTRTCTVGTELTGGVTLTGTRGQDGIMLSQVPYTGFEAGPILTFVFYSAIGLWGVVVAYALVMKKVAVAAVVGGASHAPIMSVAGAALASHAAVPNLPVFEEEALTHVVSTSDVLATLETRAHAQQALISSDALAHLVTVYGGEAEDALDRVIAASRAAFPTEDGWTVLNKDRVLAILG